MEKKTTVISQEALAEQLAFCHQINEYWHSQGITTLEEIDADARARGEAQSGTPSSFDTDEYFEDALKRSYS